MPTPHEEDPSSHELRQTHYQGYRDSINNPNPARSLRNLNHNAFGEDSDSEEHQELETHHEPPEFDVYKDFNNSGIRYATLLNQNKDPNASSDDLNQTIHPTNQPCRTKSVFIDSDKQDAPDYPFTYSITSPTAPKFKKNSQSNLKSALKNPKSRWRTGSIVAFIGVACVGTVIFFLAPRQPFISFEQPITITQLEGNNNDNNSKAFSAKNPTDFLFDAQVSLALDGRSSYLPTLIRNFRIVINDLGSISDSVGVANGQLDKGFTASTAKLTPLNVNATFKYNARNSSDTVWQNWRQACGNINQSTINGTITRPSLQLNVIISFNVIGMIGTKSDSTPLNNVACPIELPPGAPSF